MQNRDVVQVGRLNGSRNHISGAAASSDTKALKFVTVTHELSTSMFEQQQYMTVKKQDLVPRNGPLFSPPRKNVQSPRIKM